MNPPIGSFYRRTSFNYGYGGVLKLLTLSAFYRGRLEQQSGYSNLLVLVNDTVLFKAGCTNRIQPTGLQRSFLHRIQSAELTVRVLRTAVRTRHPARVIRHSDHGSQYTS